MAVQIGEAAAVHPALMFGGRAEDRAAGFCRFLCQFIHFFSRLRIEGKQNFRALPGVGDGVSGKIFERRFGKKHEHEVFRSHKKTRRVRAVAIMRVQSKSQSGEKLSRLVHVFHRQVDPKLFGDGVVSLFVKKL